MSLHKSLKSKDTLSRRRQVLARSERLERLQDDGRWSKEDGSVFGLPKVKTHVIKAPSDRPAARETAEEAAAEGEGEDTADAEERA